MRYILTLLLLSAAILKTAAQENYTLADTLTIDAAVVSGVTLTSVTDDGNLKFNLSKIEGFITSCSLQLQIRHQINSQEDLRLFQIICHQRSLSLTISESDMRDTSLL